MSAAPASGARGRVLVVDAEAAVRRGTARALLVRGFDVDTAEDDAAALTLLEARPSDVLLLSIDDAAHGHAAGLDAIERVRARSPDAVIVAMTGGERAAAAGRAALVGAYDVIARPPEDDDLFARAIDRAVERRRLGDAARASEQRAIASEPLGEVVGESQAMRDATRLALGVARTASPALLVGAPGTGKHLLARVIHRRSTRAASPLYAIDCGVFAADRLEAELFGDPKGERPGLVERADGATLLVASVTALSAAAQERLLRVVTRGEITRGPGAAVRRADVRVLACASQDLGALGDAVRFQLGAVTIHLPKLSQRKDDVPLLAYHFLRIAARRLGRDVRRVSVEALRSLRDHAWPGNVRELSAAISHAVTMARGEVVLPHDLPFSDAARLALVGPRSALFSADLADLAYADAKERATTTFDRAYVDRLLEQTGGNVSEAARRAGMDRSNFRRLVQKARGR